MTFSSVFHKFSRTMSVNTHRSVAYVLKKQRVERPLTVLYTCK